MTVMKYLVTNFVQWFFLKCFDDKILVNEFNTVTFDETGIPKRDQLMAVVGKLLYIS